MTTVVPPIRIPSGAGEGSLNGDSRGPSLSVLTTCLNEEGNVDALARRMLTVFDSFGIRGELVITDDGSSDATWEKITQWADRDSRIVGVRHDVNQGMEAGWKSSLAASSGSLVCMLDADLQNQPEDLPRFLECYEQSGVDIVQGVRVSENPPLSRYVLSRGLNLWLNLLFGMRLRDNKSGYILCQREVLEEILQHRLRYRYYQSFLAISAHVRGYSIGQIDTAFMPRMAGESFLADVPVRTILKLLGETFKARWEFRRRTTVKQHPRMQPSAGVGA